MAAFKILLMFALFTAIPAPPSNSCEPEIGKQTVQGTLSLTAECAQVCKENGKELRDHDCIVRQCQEVCKKAGGDEVLWYQFTASSKPNDYQCCKSKTPEQAKQTKPSCATCKLVNDPTPAGKILNVVLG
jgi:hypothetical protein